MCDLTTVQVIREPHVAFPIIFGTLIRYYQACGCQDTKVLKCGGY